MRGGWRASSHDHGRMRNTHAFFSQASGVLDYYKLDEKTKNAVIDMLNDKYQSQSKYYKRKSRFDCEKEYDLRKLFIVTRKKKLASFATIRLLRLRKYRPTEIGLLDLMVIPYGEMWEYSGSRLLDKMIEYASDRTLALYDFCDSTHRWRTNMLLERKFNRCDKVPRVLSKLDYLEDDVLYKWTQTVSRFLNVRKWALISSLHIYFFFIFDRPFQFFHV